MATNLKDLIDKLNAEDIPTNIFTIEDEDPYVILGKLNEVIAYLEQLRDTISSSDNKANQALENALQALQTATRAIEGSNQALDSSNTALNTANTAIATANSSLEQALEALQKANSADNKADNAVNTANEALEQVTQAQGSKVYDSNGNLMSNVNFRGENGINVDVSETDPNTLDIRLDNTITEAIEDIHNTAEANKEAITATNTAISNTNSRVSTLENEATSIEGRVDSLEGDVSSLNSQIAKTLKIPMSAPTTQKIVSVDITNAQANLNAGAGLKIENDELSTDNDNIIANILTGAINKGDKIIAKNIKVRMPTSSAGSTTPVEYMNYIKFASGLIIQWGQTYSGIDTGDYQAGVINFGTAFSYADSYVITLQGRRVSQASYRDTTFITRNYKTNKCEYMWYLQSFNQDRWHVQWIAIGY